MDIDSILDKISEALRNVPGIQAIVLGGSRARGTHSFDSDIDVGIYYDAAANATKDDPYYVQAHLTRSVSCLNQVLFALNEQYCINEKKAVRMIDGFRIRPVNYGARIGQVFREAGDDLPSACDLLEDLIRDTQALVDA